MLPRRRQFDTREDEPDVPTQGVQPVHAGDEVMLWRGGCRRGKTPPSESGGRGVPGAGPDEHAQRVRRPLTKLYAAEASDRRHVLYERLRDAAMMDEKADEKSRLFL